MAFIDELKEAFDAAEKDATATVAHHYLEALQELADFLMTKGIGAYVKVASDPRKMTLYVHPLYRPARASAMLAFFLEHEAIRMFGAKQEILKTPDELRARLIDFVKLPAFVESVRVLREEASLAVEARVQVSKKQRFSKGDVIVAVTPQDQQRLATAAVGAALDVNVERIEFPGNAAYGAAYELLDSAGIRATVEAIVANGNTLNIKGTRVN